MPTEDPNDVKFTMMLMENLDPEEQDAIVPMSVLDGKGSTTLPKGRYAGVFLISVLIFHFICIRKDAQTVH